MAELNFNALARPGPRGFMQGFQQGQEQQMTEDINRTNLETGRFKLDELKRDRAEMLQLQTQLKGMGQDPDLDKLMDVYVSSGRPDYVKMGLEGKQKLKEQREYAKLVGGDMAAPEAAVAAPAAAPAFGLPSGAQPSGDYTSTQTMGRVPGVVTTPIPDAAPMNALAAPVPAPAAAPVNALANPNAGQIQQTQKRINDLMRFAASNPGMATQAMQQARLLQDQLEMFSRAKTPETAKLADRFVPVGRLVFDRETQQYISPSQAQLAQSQERPAAPQGGGKAPSGYRFTPAGDLEAIPGGPAAQAGQPKPLTPVQSAKRRDQLGKEFKAAQSALQTTQDVLDSIAFVKSEPGLSRATGFIGTMLPSFPEGDAASAETRLKNLEGKVTALGKAAASATGSVGSIAIPEWKIMRDMIAAIDPVKGTKPMLDQIQLVEAQAQGALQRIKEGYQRQFSEDFDQFPQFADLPAPKTSFKPRAPAGGKSAAGGATGGWSVVR